MPQSHARVAIHITYSTKNRKPFLRDTGHCDELYKYVATCLKSLDSPAVIINGTEDHIHILCFLSRNYAIKTLISRIKTDSSKWIKKKGRQYRDFHWQAGYGVFSVSLSQIDSVREYIRNQKEHHKRMTFQEEFRAICARHGVELDERYVWD